jgi:hypothetical protein
MYRLIKSIVLSLIFFAWLPNLVLAQNPTIVDTTNRGGWSLMEVDGSDTLYSMSLRQVFIYGQRIFKSTEERTKYHLYKRSAKVVYPYALEAIKLYEELQEETEDMSKRKKRRHIKRTQKDLKDDFKDKLKNLTKTQGYVLVEMIERQTGKPFYDVVKEMRGGATAAYWNELGKLYGYHLKDGYELGKDPLLDEVLIEYDFGASIYKY